jgi:hypothetical protein
VHDWGDHAGNLIQKAEKERQRKHQSGGAEIPRKRRGNGVEIPRREGEGDRERDLHKKKLAGAVAPRPSTSLVEPEQKPPPNPRFKPVVDLLVRVFAEALGQPYHFTGSIDGGAVKKLLAYPEATDAEIERRARAWLSDPFNLKRAKIVVFVPDWSAAGAKAKPVDFTRGRVGSEQCINDHGPEGEVLEGVAAFGGPLR